MEKVLFLDSPMKEKLYGSRRIQEKFGLGPMDKKIGEYWAISAHDNGLSKIKNGKYKGETLKDVYLNHRELFANDPHAKFPLLVKINEIQEPCSVQVHPDDAYARKYESDYGKAEFCLWLDVEEGTKIILGHSAKTKEEFRKAIEVTNIPHIESDVHPTVTMLEGNEVIEYVNEKYFSVTRYKIQNEIQIKNPSYSLCLPLSGNGILHIDGKDYDIQAGIGFIVTSHIKRYSVKRKYRFAGKCAKIKDPIGSYYLMKFNKNSLAPIVIKPSSSIMAL